MAVPVKRTYNDTAWFTIGDAKAKPFDAQWLTTEGRELTQYLFSHSFTSNGFSKMRASKSLHTRQGILRHGKQKESPSQGLSKRSLIMPSNGSIISLVSRLFHHDSIML